MRLKLPVVFGAAVGLCALALLVRPDSHAQTPAPEAPTSRGPEVAPAPTAPATQARLPAPTQQQMNAPVVASPIAAPVKAVAPVTPQRTPVKRPQGADAAKPQVQIALLLDVSGSMDGLLEQAKAQMWTVVNELSRAKRNGVRPELQIALYAYGDGTASGEIRQVLPFTTNLDLLSEKLFALRTTGSFEPAGEVIARSVRELEWAKGPEAMKLLFIAGNEEFTQGSVDYRTAIRAAKEKHITVNTIHCGPKETGLSHGWRDAAVFADGSFLVIDQNTAIAQLEIAAPQDREIAELGVKMNATYIPFGAQGMEGQARQQAQDKNSSGISTSNMAARAISKSSGYYDNRGWDLVDANEKKAVDLGKVRAEELPAEMRGLDAQGRAAYVEAKAQEREAIRKRIEQLNHEREAFIAAERKKHAAEQREDSLDAAIVKVVKAQAAKNALTLE